MLDQLREWWDAYVVKKLNVLHRVASVPRSDASTAPRLARVEVQPGWPSDIVPYMQQQSEILLKENKIKAIPDWSKALRTDFLKQASA